MKKFFLILSVVVFILIIVVVFIIKNKSPEVNLINRIEKLSIDELVINKNDIDNIAKFYPVIVDGKKMEVIAVKATDGTIRTSFNACQVCADSGRGYFKQQGDTLVCQNCGVSFTIDQLELVRGGCNPAPIVAKEKTETKDSIVIPKETFKKYEWLYRY